MKFRSILFLPLVPAMAEQMLREPNHRELKNDNSGGSGTTPGGGGGGKAPGGGGGGKAPGGGGGGKAPGGGDTSNCIGGGVLIETSDCVPLDTAVAQLNDPANSNRESYQKPPDNPNCTIAGYCAGDVTAPTCCRFQGQISVCDISNCYPQLPCICNANTQYVPSKPPVPAPTNPPFQSNGNRAQPPADQECQIYNRNNQQYYQGPNPFVSDFNAVTMCFQASDCSASTNGQGNLCCKKGFCFCGSYSDYTSQCVPTGSPISVNGNNSG